MDKRWIVLVIALVIIISVLIYYNTPPQQPTKTTKKTQSPSLTLIANVYVNTTTINTTFFLQKNVTEVVLKAYSNESSGTIFVLDPQGHQEIRVTIAQGNDTIYTDVAFSDPPYVVLLGGTWHLNASLSEVKSVHLMIYALI
jgi:hypothetical protein